MVRPSPGAGVKNRRNSSVAGLSNVSRSRLSRSRWSGCCESHSNECAVSAVVVSKPPPISSISIPMRSRSDAGCPSIRIRTIASINPGRGVSRMSATCRIISIADAIDSSATRAIVRGVGRGCTPTRGPVRSRSPSRAAVRRAGRGSAPRARCSRGRRRSRSDQSSIFSSRHALTISSTTGTHRCTAAGDRYAFSAVRYARCSGSSISRMPLRNATLIPRAGL